jgi:Flp pilus assembly protein TadG
MKTRSLSKGQSLVEFALVFPIFFFLVTGLFDLGRVVFAYSTLNTAVREGARFAIVQPKNTAISVIESKVRSYFYDVKDFQDHSVVTVNYVGDADNPKVNVHVTYIFNPITPGLKQVLGAGHSLSVDAESEMFIAPVGK